MVPLQSLFYLIRSRLITLCGDLRSLFCVFCLQHNRAFHQKRDNVSPIIGNEESPHSPLRVEDIKDRFTQAVDRTSFFGAEIEIYVGDIVDGLLSGAVMILFVTSMCF